MKPLKVEKLSIKVKFNSLLMKKKKMLIFNKF